ncbi:unnamed protein product, partial [Tetraodon nigroviridis]
GNYVRTVQRTEQSFQACNDIVACFVERAKVEKQYAQQLSQWSNKWKSIVDSRPLYGSLMKAWQCFFTSTERLSSLHSSISDSLGQRRETICVCLFMRSFFHGFQLDKVRAAYHKSCQKEQTALDKEKQANEDAEMSPEKKEKLAGAREKATGEKLKYKEQYEKVLEDVSAYTPRYMEEMESIFEQSQEEERKRISFLKQAFLSIHRHLDVTNNESVKAVYNELHQTLMSISEQEDLKWWKNNHGPGMPTDWPKVESDDWGCEGASSVRLHRRRRRRTVLQSSDELLSSSCGRTPTMEFACGFVYVPPLASQKDSPRGNGNLVKRSALLPPVSRWVRPQTPPPPPPVNPTEAISAKSALRRNTEGLIKDTEINAANAEVHSKRAAGSPVSPAHQPTPPRKTESADKGILPGNPNVVLVSLGKLLSEQRGQRTSIKVNVCYFCQDLSNSSGSPLEALPGYRDDLFLLHPDEKPLTAEPLLLFCIDVSGSMSITSQVTEKEGVVHRSRLHEAVIQCVQRLSDQQPDMRVGLITFNNQVIICTDGKANTDLGNLQVEDDDARTLLSSTIFYQELGEYAANVGRVKGEREAGHKGLREVGNVDPDTEITFQFGAHEQNTLVAAPASGSCVSIQLQVRYRQRNGQTMLRVISSERTVTDNSAAILSSLSLAIIQLNSSQASAALAVRGRFLDARREGKLQRQLIEAAIEHNRSVDDKHTYHQWVKTMEPIYKNIFHFTRSLTDAGAALLYTMKHCNRKSITLKDKQKLSASVQP